MKAFNNGSTVSATKNVERKYFKYNYTTFVQPTIGVNSLMGRAAFAVDSSPVYQSNYAWRAFDGNVRTVWESSSQTANEIYLEFYNPNPLVVSKLSIQNRTANASYIPKTGSVSGSNDGENWTQITTWTNTTGTTAGALWDIDVNSNTAYKYHKLTITSNTSYPDGHYSLIPELYITATEQTVGIGTDSDYDYYLDLDTYKAVA